MLIMKNVSKTFNPGTVNEKCALKNLNLELKDGDFATIIGRRKHLSIRQFSGTNILHQIIFDLVTQRGRTTAV